MAMKKPRLSRPRKLLAIGLAALGGLAVLEIAVRTGEALFPSVPPLRRNVDRPVFRLDPAQGRFVGLGQSFAADKPTDGVRVFCLGGSAARGFPHAYSHSYPARLASMLKDAMPGRSVEVLNAAQDGFSSENTLAVLREVLDHRPDAVLVWTGNNEYLARYLHTFESLGPLRASAAARLVARTFFPRKEEAPDPWAFRLAAMQRRPNPFRTDPLHDKSIRRNYEANLRSIARECRGRGVPLFLATVPVNLKDWAPVASAHAPGLNEDGRAAWRGKFREGSLAQERGDHAAARDGFLAALRLDDGHAEAHYRLARSLLRLGERDQAKRHFLAAAENDLSAFRTRPSFNEAVARVARDHGARLVDLAGLLNGLDEDGVAGEKSVVDHVHPAAESNVPIARAMFGALADAGVAEGPPPPPRPVPTPARNADVVNFLFRIHVVMHQYSRVRPLGEELIRLWKPADAPGLDARAFVDRVVAATEDFAALERAEALGLAAFTADQASGVRERYYALAEEFASQALSRRSAR
jgi:tetratricopeptide (TPR) repeat protein